MDNYRYDRQDASSFKETRRVVTAQAGPYTSLQLPVVICNEQYKSVIDVGLPTSLISTAIWQKVSSPLFPIGESEIAERVTRRTNLQLMGYTHFQLQVGQTVLELEDALVYDYDEPEIFLSISAVAALGLVLDFQEGTFGLRSVDGLRCSWNEDTVLFPNNSLGNFSLLNKPKPSAGSYYDYTGSVNEGHHTNNMAPFRAPGNLMGNMNKEITGHIPIGIDELSMGIPGLGELNYSDNYNEMASMPPPPPMDLVPIQPPVNIASLNPYSMAPGPMCMVPPKKQKKLRKSVNFKKFKNFYLKPIRSGNNSKGHIANNKLLNKIAHWNKDNREDKTGSKAGSTGTNKGATNKGSTNKSSTNKSATNTSSTNGSTTTPQKTTPVKQVGVNTSTISSPNVQNKISKNQKRKAKRKLQALVSPIFEKKLTAPKTVTNADNKDKKKIQCVNCHAKEHTIESCTKPIALKCVYCGQAGHLRTNCPTVLKTSSAVSEAPETSQTTLPIIPAAENLQSSEDISVTKPESETPVVTKPESEMPVVASTAVAVKRPASSPEKGIVKKQIIETSSETPFSKEGVVAVQKPVEDVTYSVSSAKTENKLPTIAFDPLQDSDDSFKKPELDLAECEPVKRVVAKRNIKLNMLPKSNTSVSKECSSDSDNALSKDMPMKCATDTTAAQQELEPVKTQEVQPTQVPVDGEKPTIVGETLVPTETSI